MHDNWVAYFRTWRRRSLFSGRAPTCRSQSNVWNSQRLLHVIPKFETKILRLDIFAQVNLINVAPTLQNLRIGLKKWRNGKSKVPAKQRGSWPTMCTKLIGAWKNSILLTFGACLHQLDSWWHSSFEYPALIDRGNLLNGDWANYSWNDSQMNLMQNYSDIR